MKQFSERSIKALLAWLNGRLAPQEPPAQAEALTPPVPPEDAVVADEKIRINDLRTVAKWQLASLGTVATISFAGVALNKLPNAADAETGGWTTLLLAGVGALVTLISIVMIIRSVGNVLAPQFISLNDQLIEDHKNRSSRRRRQVDKWYNQAIFYLPDISIGTLEEYTKKQKKAYEKYETLKSQKNLSAKEKVEMEEVASKILEYYDPVGLRLHWRNRREIVAIRTRAATQQFGLFGALAAVGIVTYLGANSYHLPSGAYTVSLPVYGIWRPLNAVKPELTSAGLAADLGEKCPLAVEATQGAGAQVIVLAETPDTNTYRIVVVQQGCNLRQYTVLKDTVAARDPISLPPGSATVIGK